jgi:hypothetical protein
MWLHSDADCSNSASPARRTRQMRHCCQRRAAPGRKLFLEHLEVRDLPSGGVTPSLVKLGEATPLPIQLPLSLAGSPFGGPDIYQNFQGPADGKPGFFGNEPNQITNFKGDYGGARVQGTGTDNHGHTLLWDADLRFMKGVYQGLDGELHQRTFVEV